MAKQLFINNFDWTFTATVNATFTTSATEAGYGALQISSGAFSMMPALTGGDYLILTAYKLSSSVESAIEVMKCTAFANGGTHTAITVNRAQEGTVAQAYSSGDHIAIRFTKGGADNMLQTGGNLAGLADVAVARTNLGLGTAAVTNTGTGAANTILGNDTRLTDSRVPTGTAGGVLGGTYPNPSFAVDMATQAELDAAIATREAAITGTTSADLWTGAKTFVSIGTSVRNAVLSGLSLVTNAAVTATNTVLEAIGLLQKQITDHVGSGASAHAAVVAAGANGFMTGADKTKLDGIASGAQPGTVTSVGLSLPAIFTLSGTPVTGSGTLTGALASQTANQFWAAPNGIAGAPVFRAIVASDIPTLNQATTANAGSATVLATPRTISGVSFNGSANIVIDYSGLSGLPTLGTAAAKNIPAAGNASATEVVYGTDTRLTDARAASDVSAWAKAGTKPTYTYAEVGAQQTLVSGTSIKTVGGVSLLGAGDIGTLAVGYGGTGVTTSTGSGANVLGTSPAITTPTLTNPTLTNFTETVYAPAAGAAFTVDLDNGAIQKFTTTAATTITLPAAAAGKSYLVIVVYGGAHTITWAGGTAIKWAGGTAPTATSVNGKEDWYVFSCADTGSTRGQDGGRNF